MRHEKKATLVYIPADIAEKIRAFLREVWAEEDVDDMITYLVWQAVLYALDRKDFAEFYIERAGRGEGLEP